MLISYKGRKSHTVYTIPVNYVVDCNTLWTTSFRQRTWWRNLRGGAEVTVQLKGETLQALGLAIDSPAEVIEKLKIFLQLVPSYAKYFGVSLDSENQPDPADIANAAKERVMIRFELPHCSPFVI